MAHTLCRGPAKSLAFTVVNNTLKKYLTQNRTCSATAMQHTLDKIDAKRSRALEGGGKRRTDAQHARVGPLLW